MPEPTDDAATIVASLDLPTKVALLSGRGFWETEAVPSAGLDRIVLSDGPHGLRCQVGSGDHLGVGASRPATCFPTAVTLGSSWDVGLATEVGEAVGEEALAQGVAVVLGPGLNLKRHPAGGRNFEYLSEDPHLAGHLAAASVKGIQSRGVGTSMKHYAVNNQESHRLVVDALVDERTLRELYLAGFEIVVKQAAPSTVMCSYNRINGTYASDHHELLTTILRDEWGYEGLVVSDWGATNDRVAAIAAGMDLEMPGSKGAFDEEVLDAVRSGRLADADVDRCAARVVSLIQRGQHVRKGADGPPEQRPDPGYEAHHRLARRAAAAGSVLLTNNGVLPLAPAGRIAVVGGFATEPRYQGAGSSQVRPTQLDVALTELRARVGDGATVLHAVGYDALTGAATDEQIHEAVEAARDADVAVCFAGLPAATESEGFDRTDLDLPAGQVRLIEALAVLDTPLVVVLNNGGVVHLPWAERADAVLECWLGGQAGGGAVVDVLFGDAEPGGRLAESIPHHVAQLPADAWFPGHPRQVQYREGLNVGYRFHDTAGVPSHFAFGSGLSYTTFDWTGIDVTGSGTDRAVTVTVTNTGERAGSDVVQVYVRGPRDGAVVRPHQELRGFAKVHLAPGQSDTVTVHLSRRSFAVWDVDAHDWLVEAGRYQVVVARSSVAAAAVVDLDIESPDRLGADPRPSARAANDVEFAEMLRRPIPTPAAARPFNRNSTLEDLESTAGGRLLSKIIVREGLRRAAKEFPDPDEATVEMVRAAVREGPARGLALMSGGAISLRQLDALLAGLEGRFGSAISTLCSSSDA